MQPSSHRYTITTGLVLSLVAMVGCTASQENKAAVFPFSQWSKSTEKPILNASQTADVELAMARSAEQQGQYSSAMRIYRQLLEADPKHPAATHRIAILYDRQGDFEQAEEWFQKALRRSPNDPELLCDVGYSHYSQGRLQTAEGHLRKAIELSPEHHRAHNHLGMVLAQSGDLEGAFNAFCAAQSTPAQAYTNLALKLALDGNSEEARRHLGYARNAGASPPELHERWANLEVLIGGPGAASPASPVMTASVPSGPIVR